MKKGRGTIPSAFLSAAGAGIVIAEDQIVDIAFHCGSPPCFFSIPSFYAPQGRVMNVMNILRK